MDRPSHLGSAVPMIDFRSSRSTSARRRHAPPDGPRVRGRGDRARAAGIDRANEFPMDLWKKFGDLGLLGVTAEEEYGGAQLGYVAHIVAVEEISRASAAVGSRTARTRTCA